MTRGRRWPGLFAALMVVGIAACWTEAPGVGTSFDAEGVRFVAPAGWNVRGSRMVSSGPARVLSYVANQPLHDDCRNEPTRTDCQLPIADLRVGGVFIWWRTSTCVAAGCALPDGEPTLVGRREAVRAPADGACTGLTVTGEAQVAVLVSPQRVDTIYICTRQPDDAALIGLQSILDSVVWRTH